MGCTRKEGKDKVTMEKCKCAGTCRRPDLVKSLHRGRKSVCNTEKGSGLGGCHLEEDKRKGRRSQKHCADGKMQPSVSTTVGRKESEMKRNSQRTLKPPTRTKFGFELIQTGFTN